ncbi:DUF1513 domain-containing protein [Deefgea salmonis]|uniref:DUF1513 domain-containing protein n=1 Tax=Deefgea salmonis TaxID=2875502 RepID=A0ABS8BHQ2_9NEIS|nr:DUF1513 domain-containing protein [Deefgea salmonis]MCB5195172.1 DUF1513 domain-containing protein [Deefgea salmonis]
MLTRRQFVLQLAAMALPLPTWAASRSVGDIERVLLSASWDADTRGEVQGVFRSLTSKGAPSMTLPGRGHGIVPLSDGQAMIVSRRLGSWLAKVDWQQGKVLQLIDAEFDRQFFGHAILTPDGKTLITTENNGETGQGVLGLYSTDTLKRLGEIPSHGIGPHELIWLKQGNILAIANGGILTLPETGRRKLNVDAMHSKLSLLAWPSGALLNEYVLPDPALSIRHLALAADGSLGIALQAEYRDAAAHVNAPLLAVLRQGQLQVAAQPDGLQGYGASIAAVGDTFLISALKGNALARWRSDGTPLAPIAMSRPAGIASDGAQAWISSESGFLAHFEPNTATLTKLQQAAGPRWDNHLVIGYVGRNTDTKS